MNSRQHLKLLFIINPGAGNKGVDWPAAINDFFQHLPHTTEQYLLTRGCNTDSIKDKISDSKPDRVIAVGGDGTVKLVAECLLHTEITMGIVPAGSANGLAKELHIPTDTSAALQHLLKEETQKIHLVKINGQLCVHLSDIGFNASVIKIFESEKRRGMMGYVKAAWRVLWRHSVMQATIQIDNSSIKRDAAMIVIANATRYGSGAIINPMGRLDDDLFEIVIIRKVSFTEIFKMMVSHTAYDKTKTELFQTQSLHIHSKRKAHFQVDGEYLGKTNHIEAIILKSALRIIQ
ncbi:MAG: YegS/Rv2252/BmrU family lipid kinase [Chitinophagaceae bacterium]